MAHKNKLGIGATNACAFFCPARFAGGVAFVEAQETPSVTAAAVTQSSPCADDLAVVLDTARAMKKRRVPSLHPTLSSPRRAQLSQDRQSVVALQYRGASSVIRQATSNGAIRAWTIAASATANKNEIGADLLTRGFTARKTMKVFGLLSMAA